MLNQTVQLLKSWEYKNTQWAQMIANGVVQLLKSWEYKNLVKGQRRGKIVVQLLKSWEYKNQSIYAQMLLGVV